MAYAVFFSHDEMEKINFTGSDVHLKQIVIIIILFCSVAVDKIMK